MFYQPQVATLCDICEKEDCEKVCGGSPGSQAGEDKGAGVASSLSSTLVILFLSVILLRCL